MKQRRCWVVVRRTLTAELIDLLGVVADLVATRGRSLAWNRSTPTMTAYWMAVRRLSQAGLVARRRTGGRTPVIALTSTGEQRVSEVIRPERWWDQDWDGCWHVLMYDVPEATRGYRVALWGFLRRQRMGALQKSVWLSCRDVRPAFADLQQSASIGDFAVLLEAKTLLGQTGPELAARAWNFDRLQEAQQDYIRACKERLARGQQEDTPERLLELLRREQAEYHGVMARDPLLPRALWPPGYLGPATVTVFRSRMKQVASAYQARG